MKYSLHCLSVKFIVANQTPKAADQQINRPAPEIEPGAQITRVKNIATALWVRLLSQVGVRVFGATATLRVWKERLWTYLVQKFTVQRGRHRMLRKQVLQIIYISSIFLGWGLSTFIMVLYIIKNVFLCLRLLRGSQENTWTSKQLSSATCLAWS